MKTLNENVSRNIMKRLTEDVDVNKYWKLAVPATDYEVRQPSFSFDELKIGTKLVHSGFSKPVIIVGFSEEGYTDNYPISGVKVKPIDSLNEYEIIFDNETLRQENRVGEQFSKIKEIIND